MRIFFAGPLTDLKDPEKTKLFYKHLAQTASGCGFDYFWAFMNGTDPVLNPDVSPQDVYERDMNELQKSDLMITYVGEPSTGTGLEIEYAFNHHIPVYILYEKDKRISRMLRGCPAVKKELIFSGEDDALRQFKDLLLNLKK